MENQHHLDFLRKQQFALGAALLTALFNIAIFPRLDLSWLAFIAFLPLLLTVPFHRSRFLFLLFYLSGLAFHIGNLYWIYHVIQHYTNLYDVASVGILLLLCLVLSLFWGFFGLALGYVFKRKSYAAAMILAPFLWIILEWLRSYTTHFPWCYTGYSQYKNLRVAQLATIAGVYGLSFLILSVNASLALLVSRRKMGYAVVVVAAFLLIVSYGHYRISVPVGTQPIQVGVVQGNIPQDVKINYNFAEEVHEKHMKMTRELLAMKKLDLIFWTEASTLFPLKNGGLWTDQIIELVRQSRIPMVIGSDSFEGEEIYNSAFFINERGEVEAQYDKIYLVPFGEFVPFKDFLFFAGKVVPEISDFTPGSRYDPFVVDGKKFSINICFEVVFPQLSRGFCNKGTQLLSTITNDAWFGRSSAPYQHFAMAVMRAIENRRYLVRAANTGISGFVDPYGRILSRTDIFQPAIFTGEVRWIDEKTIYTRYGDWLVYVAIVFCFIYFIRIRKWKIRSAEEMWIKPSDRILTK